MVSDRVSFYVPALHLARRGHDLCVLGTEEIADVDHHEVFARSLSDHVQGGLAQRAAATRRRPAVDAGLRALALERVFRRKSWGIGLSARCLGRARLERQTDLLLARGGGRGRSRDDELVLISAVASEQARKRNARN